MPIVSQPNGGSRRTTFPRALSSKIELLKHLGVTPAEFDKIWWFRARMYTHFNVPKKSGNVRVISAPDHRLKMLQKKIARLLTDIYEPRNPVHGFTKDRSVKSNAISHLSRRFMLNVDLKDFFQTITEARVDGLLRRLGLSEDVAGAIARLCTNNNCLPQGAPSSPIISNMICFRLDRSLMKFAKEHRLIYTRYADDITLSSFQPPTALFEGDRPDPGKLTTEKLSRALISIFDQNGFRLNSEKIYYADRNSRRAVTGIKTNEGLNLDRKYVRNIRSALFKVERIGIAAAQTELVTRLHRSCGIQGHLQGKISWLGYVKGQSDPVFRSLAQRYNTSFPDHRIEVQPKGSDILDRSVWVLETDVNTGTAFFLSGIGLITAAHCVEGASRIEVFHPSKTSNKFKVTVKNSCKHRDLALLDHTIPETDHFELRTGTASPAPGLNTVAAGFPSYGPGDNLNIRHGTISSLTIKHAVKLVEVTQKLSQGMSGGPLMTDDHSVIGVVHKGGPAEPRDFAVALSELFAWIATQT